MIYAVAIINHSGKLILARQFTHENKNQIDAQLGAFPKLVQFSAHAYIDAESVRFVYQDINDLYIILVVSKDSNLVTDLETLSLLVDVTRSSAGDIKEDCIITNGLDIIMAYDECIFDGFRQDYTSAQINHFLQMKSAAEDEANRIRAEKEAKAAADLKKHLMMLDESKHGQKSSFIPSFVQSSFDNFQSSSQKNKISIVDDDYNPAPYRPAPRPSRGMSLSRSYGTKSKVQQVMAEEGIEVPAAFDRFNNDQFNEGGTSLESKPTSKNQNDLVITLHEKLTAILSRSDAVREIGIEGRLLASCGQKLCCTINLDKESLPSNYRYKVMQQPKGKLWQEESKLVYDNTGPKYGPSSEITLLCWRMTSTNPDDLPIEINYWVNPSKNTSTISCEVELKKKDFDADLIEIYFPIIDPRKIRISACAGQSEVSEQDQYLKWTVEKLSEDNEKAEIEFVVPVCDDDALYPVTISFIASSTLCNVNVTGIETHKSVRPKDEDDIDDSQEDDVNLANVTMPKYEVTKICKTNKYEIE